MDGGPGTGGASATGGQTGEGGASTGGAGGGATASGGVSGLGGGVSSGGASGLGGSVSSGGASGQGGVAGRGGATGSGGGAGASTGGGGGTTGTGAGGGGASSSGGAGGMPDQSALPAVTIHMAGDSTMSNYDATTTQEGWGQELGQFFINKVTIDNQAQPGANIQTFYSGRWKTLIGNVKAGDYVMAAFGINDSGTTHGPVTPADFQTQMGVMADEVAAKKATFIPTTSSPLQVWVGGKETNMRLQPYCDATIAIGMMKGLLVDDLNARGVAYYNMIGQTAAAALTFNGDKAHFDKAGATAMAQLAAQELTRINSPLAAYLK
jgi:lysophospholipase L1-like esterase